MAETENANARRDLASRAGTFFIVIGIFAIAIFVASDISRNGPAHKASVTQTYIVEAIQAIQTRDAGATKAAIERRPTPRLAPVRNHDTESMLTYLPLFCLGSLGLLVGWFLKRTVKIPSKPNTRFEGIRKMIQRQREAKAKREKEAKEKKEKKEKELAAKKKK